MRIHKHLTKDDLPTTTQEKRPFRHSFTAERVTYLSHLSPLSRLPRWKTRRHSYYYYPWEDYREHETIFLMFGQANRVKSYTFVFATTSQQQKKNRPFTSRVTLRITFTILFQSVSSLSVTHTPQVEYFTPQLISSHLTRWVLHPVASSPLIRPIR